MDNKGTIQLETDRLILRKGTINDAKQIYENYGKDPAVSKYVVWNKHENIQEAVNLMEKWNKSYNNPSSYKWVVVEKSSNKVIGSITAVDVDEKSSNITVGYCYGSRWWNKGYGTEALKRVIKFFFDDVNANSVSADFLSPNIASGKVMINAGMKFVGENGKMVDKNTNKLTVLQSYIITKKDYLGK